MACVDDEMYELFVCVWRLGTASVERAFAVAVVM